MTSNEVMPYVCHVHEASRDAARLETIYREAMRDGKADLFAQAVKLAHAQQPEELLFAAWHHRLIEPLATIRSRSTAWAWAAPLAVLNGLLWWWVAVAAPQLDDRAQFLAALALGASPAGLLLLYFACAGRRAWPRVALLTAALALVTVVAYGILPGIRHRDFQDQYRVLTLLHFPLLSWAAVGLYLCWQRLDGENRFAYMAKSLEALIVGALLGITLFLFTGITYGLFHALGIDLPERVGQLFAFGGAGMIAVLAMALVHEPDRDPAMQGFDRGLSPVIATLMRLLLLPTLAVLAVYAAMIPASFFRPFENREVLIVYNAMQLAVMVLLIGVAPARDRDGSGALTVWLRRGIIALALLALIVSLHAFSALAYRTATAVWTPNRLAFLGWNVIGIGMLGALLVRQISSSEQTWLRGLKETLAAGAVAAVGWALLVILALPWLFGAASHLGAVPR